MTHDMAEDGGGESARRTHHRRHQQHDQLRIPRRRSPKFRRGWVRRLFILLSPRLGPLAPRALRAAFFGGYLIALPLPSPPLLSSASHACDDGRA